MKIGVIGAGRLGICFALLCEAAGYDVLVSDIREDYVNDLNERKIKTHEPEVENLLRVDRYQRLINSYCPAGAHADCQIAPLRVPSPNVLTTLGLRTLCVTLPIFMVTSTRD